MRRSTVARGQALHHLCGAPLSTCRRQAFRRRHESGPAVRFVARKASATNSRFSSTSTVLGRSSTFVFLWIPFCTAVLVQVCSQSVLFLAHPTRSYRSPLTTHACHNRTPTAHKHPSTARATFTCTVHTPKPAETATDRATAHRASVRAACIHPLTSGFDAPVGRGRDVVSRDRYQPAQPTNAPARPSRGRPAALGVPANRASPGTSPMRAEFSRRTPIYLAVLRTGRAAGMQIYVSHSAHQSARRGK